MLQRWSIMEAFGGSKKSKALSQRAQRKSRERRPANLASFSTALAFDFLCVPPISSAPSVFGY
jgi:hypothetical protein